MKWSIYILCFTAFTAMGAIRSIEKRIDEAAARFSLDPDLVRAIVKVESNFSTGATSKKGAMGLMQVMPDTAKECGIKDPYHPLDNLMGACQCLRVLINKYQGKLKLVLAAYNAGPANVKKYKGVPPFPETKEYVRKVLAFYSQLKKNPNF